ncbi:hypothetical protein TNCT1_54940 [Streptomyces sp. 1-11]|nr:hypothetical protein TNCT1_54940 [Streptomyces sp. 1-11]
MAPDRTETNSSSTEASKLGEENWSTRSPGPTAYRSAAAETKPPMPRWVTVTPLGVPVEPDV